MSLPLPPPYVLRSQHPTTTLTDVVEAPGLRQGRGLERRVQRLGLVAISIAAHGVLFSPSQHSFRTPFCGSPSRCA